VALQSQLRTLQAMRKVQAMLNAAEAQKKTKKSARSKAAEIISKVLPAMPTKRDKTVKKEVSGRA
jgi:hypothetical protein